MRESDASFNYSTGAFQFQRT